MIDSLNGLFSLVKYGLSECYGGLAPVSDMWNRPECEDFAAGSTYTNEGVMGQNTFTPSASSETQALVDELATLLTDGRLSRESRELIEQVVSQEADPVLKNIKAQQLIVAAPEFHITNVVRKTGNPRPALQAHPPSVNSYKAVVYVLLDGGADTFNMLAPHSCTATNVNGKTLL